MTLSPDVERDLEAHTVALNRWLYAEGVGLDVDAAGYAAPAAALAGLYERLLDHADTATRFFALESWSEARRLPLDEAVTDAMDAHLSAPDLTSSEGPLTWRNWKAFERETDDAGRLREGYERLVAQSAALTPHLEARLARVRADFAARGLTPVHTFCWREGVTPEALRAFLLQAGEASRAPFQAALAALSQAVFGRPAGPAELRALYLNRMYEPTNGIFAKENTAGHAGSAFSAVQTALGVFRASGFDLSAVPIDLESRPRKYPGAFCFPVAIPGDVRVSVRVASAHHLIDMLYHEFGHAAHFSGIRPDLPFVDRYWIHSGVHETFSTLFEYLLAEPEFLAETFRLGDAAVERLLAFARFKRHLTLTWSGAEALTALDVWLEGLDWAGAEARFADWLARFTGMTAPPGYARLNPFVSALSIYPAGYVLAEARVARWLRRLRTLGGAAWWRSSEVQAEIRDRIRQGGRAVFASPPTPEQ